MWSLHQSQPLTQLQVQLQIQLQCKLFRQSMFTNSTIKKKNCISYWVYLDSFAG
jgi:hypothetical protein